MAGSLHLRTPWRQPVSQNPTTYHSRSVTKFYQHKSFKSSFSLNSLNPEFCEPDSTTSPEQVLADPVKLAFQKAKAYKKSLSSKPSPEIIENRVESLSGNGEIPAAVAIAAGNEPEYKTIKKSDAGTKTSSITGTSDFGLNEENGANLGNEGLETTVSRKNDKLRVSSIDFIGLGFADKKQGRGPPAGLVPVSQPFSDRELEEVEIIVGDKSKFDDPITMKPDHTREENSELYKPKVSTWGVFPRPNNISKTFGGGKTIRPGDVLETKEDRAAKDEHTRQLVAAYKKKFGLTINPKLNSECEKVFNDGEFLMDAGNLKDAILYYEKVMDKLPFQSELHGLAALQWSVCQDSLCRSNEARIMYEKLRSHPNPEVRKKAAQFLFSFEAMEMMKVTESNRSWENTGYQNYFEAFIEDKNNYKVDASEVEEEEEGALNETLIYILFLVLPLLMLLFIIANRGFTD